MTENKTSISKGINPIITDEILRIHSKFIKDPVIFMFVHPDISDNIRSGKYETLDDFRNDLINTIDVKMKKFPEDINFIFLHEMKLYAIKKINKIFKKSNEVLNNKLKGVFMLPDVVGETLDNDTEINRLHNKMNTISRDFNSLRSAEEKFFHYENKKNAFSYVKNYFEDPRNQERIDDEAKLSNKNVPEEIKKKIKEKQKTNSCFYRYAIRPHDIMYYDLERKRKKTEKYMENIKTNSEIDREFAKIKETSGLSIMNH